MSKCTDHTHYTDYKYTNHILKLIELICLESVDYMWLAGNPNITMDYIKKNPDKPWNPFRLLSNSSITWDMVLEILDSEEMFASFQKLCKGNLAHIAWDKLRKEIRAGKNIPHTLCYNQNMTWKIMVDNFDLDSAAYNIYEQSHIIENPGVTIADYEGSPHLWGCNMQKRFTKNPNFTWEFAQHKDEKRHFQLHDDHYDYMSANPNITWDIIQANLDKPWNWTDLSMNPNITWDIIQANPHLPWVWTSISANPNITWDIVQANPDKPWCFSYMCLNPNLTWKIIAHNLDKLNYIIYLIMNKFERHPFIMNKIRKQIVTNHHFLPQDLAKIVADYIRLGEYDQLWY